MIGRYMWNKYKKSVNYSNAFKIDIKRPKKKTINQETEAPWWYTKLNSYFTVYQKGGLTKEEYEKVKTKILDQVSNEYYKKKNVKK